MDGVRARVTPNFAKNLPLWGEGPMASVRAQDPGDPVDENNTAASA
jgi:hypothetical protein